MSIRLQHLTSIEINGLEHREHLSQMKTHLSLFSITRLLIGKVIELIVFGFKTFIIYLLYKIRFGIKETTFFTVTALTEPRHQSCKSQVTIKVIGEQKRTISL